MTRKKRVFPGQYTHNLLVQSSKPQKMALGVASLTLDDSQASLASMPDELWRKVTSYLRPATTARAFVVASGSSSLQKALRAEIEQTERDQFGATRRGAEELLVDGVLIRHGCTRAVATHKLVYILHTCCSSSEHEGTELRWGRHNLSTYSRFDI